MPPGAANRPWRGDVLFDVSAAQYSRVFLTLQHQVFSAMKQTGVVMVVSLLASACSVFGVRTAEEAPYEVVREDGRFEIREYAPIVVAETVVEGERGETENSAFFRLFDFIQGENESAREIEMTAPVIQERTGEKIAMTAPVLQERGSEGWTMSFVLPKEYTLENAPRPTSSDVRLREVGPSRLAAVRFSGLRSASTIERETESLRAWIAEQGLTETSSPRLAAYDPPFTLPFLRRNEVLIEVD
jgi:hypothetical protein